MLTRLRQYRIEIKYLLLTAISLAILYYVAHSGVLQGVQDKTAELLDWVANKEGLVGGSIGLFVLALIANTSLLIQIPYTIPLMNIAILSDSIFKVLILSIATGMGAGLGEINSYMIARGLSAPIGSPEDSRLFRWIKNKIETQPRLIPYLVLLGSATPLPDDLVIWPLAIAKYPVKKILLPMFVGKIFHNFAFGLIAFYGVDLVNQDEATVRVDLTIGVLFVFLFFIMYQIEKARQKQKEAALEGPPAPDDLPAIPTA